MTRPDTNAADADIDVVGLRALAWTIADPERARRLIDLTGLDPAALRTRAGEPEVLAAVLGFLEANERDLVTCADDLGLAPGSLVAARERLEAAR